ncbi:MAG: hypothetical protein UHE93_01665 [Muribaculaceae bacterium]|nr:hypothetical protein [Muribaculaceae bacterium]
MGERPKTPTKPKTPKGQCSKSRGDKGGKAYNAQRAMLKEQRRQWRKGNAIASRNRLCLQAEEVGLKYSRKVGLLALLALLGLQDTKN